MEEEDKHVRDGALLSRARGAWLGQFTGDALGSMVEFMPARTIRERYPEGLRIIGPSPVWGTVAGQPTDDSEMALVLARSLLAQGSFDQEAVARGYVGRIESAPFDVGNTVQQAVGRMQRALEVGEDPVEAARRGANRQSQANGALMRQSGLGIWGWHLPPEHLAHLAQLDTELTHPHPVCVEASAAYLVALAATIREGLNGEAAYRRAVEWQRVHGHERTVDVALSRAAVEAPFTGSPLAGWVLVALQNAFYQALHAPSFEEGVVRTVMAGGDSDTNGAIAGAMLGAIHGVDEVPMQWRETVLACRPAAGSPGVERPRPPAYWPSDALEVAAALAG